MIDRLIEKKLVPDKIIRMGIRSLLEKRLKDERKNAGKLPQLIASMKASPIAILPKDANEQHYEVPADFFKLVLGHRMKYSSGYWYEGTQSLDMAEAAMLEISADRADLTQGQKILELGCGWGSFSTWIAESFPHAQVLGVSNSRSQKEFIDKRASEIGLKNLSILTADMNSFDTTETFDRIVSVEMFEHMRNWEKLLEKVSLWLRPGGLFFMHIFTHRDLTYFFEDNGPSDWMTRYFFSGGMMPGDGLPYHFQKDLKIIRHWFVPGTHYGKTARAWLNNLDRNKAKALEILAKTYGPAEAAKHFSRWRVFFMSCEELWNYAMGTEWQVSHYLFKKD